ncbi:hypothetical protein [Gloeobacter morelensis]|uniref:Secreted protein n=1 Tax=Gloeobacter morelensis MG652769 TaxID=2781736 RepID=A0ABY3PMW8_9CYAN|nr:hypothetical protein [Gloeobacter morelensis]UFP95042.1 hypothetical protein ISF26_01980 [Gloeobacter morelensis MG652769]
MLRTLCPVLAAGLLLVAVAPAAQADRIIIPVFQSQTSIIRGTQAQGAGSGYGGSSQSGALNQASGQAQTVNVYVPEDFDGNVTTVDLGDRNRRFGRDERFGRDDRFEREPGDWRERFERTKRFGRERDDLERPELHRRDGWNNRRGERDG